MKKKMRFFFFSLTAKTNRHTVQSQSRDKSNIEMRSTQKSEVIRSRHRHITLMLLAVAVVFLLLTLPNSIYFVLDITYGFNTPPTTNDFSQWLRYRRLTLLTVIMYQLSDVQHATNFFLYLLTSKKFRRTILMICTSSGHFLLSFFHCCCPEKIPSTRTFPNHFASTSQHEKKTFSMRSSESDMSSNHINPRATSTRRIQSYNYTPLASKPSTSVPTATTEMS